VATTPSANANFQAVLETGNSIKDFWADIVPSTSFWPAAIFKVERLKSDI
jgi:hypothetical protein